MVHLLSIFLIKIQGANISMESIRNSQISHLSYLRINKLALLHKAMFLFSVFLITLVIADVNLNGLIMQISIRCF